MYIYKYSSNLKKFHVGQELSRGEPLVVIVELRHVVEVLTGQRPPTEGNDAGHFPVRRSSAQRIQQGRLARTYNMRSHIVEIRTR